MSVNKKFDVGKIHTTYLLSERSLMTNQCDRCGWLHYGSRPSLVIHISNQTPSLSCNSGDMNNTRRRNKGGHELTTTTLLRTGTTDNDDDRRFRIINTTTTAVRNNGKLILLALALFVYCVTHLHVSYSHDETSLRRSATGTPQQNAQNTLVASSSSSSTENGQRQPKIHPAVNLIQRDGEGRAKMIALGNQNDKKKTQTVPTSETKLEQAMLSNARMRAQEGPNEPLLPLVQTAVETTDTQVESLTRKDAAVDVLLESFPSSANVTKLSDKLEQCQSTIVTAYFKIPSKHKAAQYTRWMKFFLSIKDCLVIFASQESMAWVEELRKDYPTRTVLIEMEVKDLPIGQLHASESTPTTENAFWKHQLEIDDERQRHKHFFLFQIWLSKSWFVQEAIKQNFFESDYFMWQDIGSYRNGNYHLQKIIQHVEVIPPKQVFWLAHHPPNPPPEPVWCEKEEKPEHFFHSGSQGIAHKDAWLEYHYRFAETIDVFIEKNMFLGEDQCLLQGTCQRYPDLCAYFTFDQLPKTEHRYFGLRYFLRYPGNYTYWRMPGATATK